MSDSTTPLRVAIAGLGRRGWHSAERLARRRDVVVVADWDPEGKSLPHLAPGSRIVEHCGDILRTPQLDALISATNHPDAADIVESALRSGVAVARDGTLATTAAEARRLAGAAEAGGARLAVLKPGRGEGDFRTALAAVATGELGRLTAVRNTVWTPPLVGGQREAGGIEPVATAIDQALSLMAEIPVAALLTWRASSSRRDDVPADGFALMLRFPDGAVAQIDRYHDAALLDHSGWVLSGTSGGYRMGRFHRRQPDGEVYDVPFEELPDSATAAIDEWIDSLRVPPPPDANLHHDVAVAAVLEAAIGSAERGQFVPIP